MNLYDKLPAEDKQLIKDYLTFYTRIDDIPDLGRTLQEWSKNKKTLYRALGGHFRVTVPIQTNFKVGQEERFKSLNKKYGLKVPWDDNFYDVTLNKTSHIFFHQLFDYLWEEKFLSALGEPHYTSLMIAKNIGYTLRWCHFFNGYVPIFPYDTLMFGGKTLKLQKGTKPLRVLRQILNLIEFPHMDSFQRFCNDVSVDLTNKNNTTVNLTFSIHPIDFMTMSHNTCNWTSCMDWQGGAYSTGVLEMMNSNMAIVAYVESSSQDFKINHRQIPNKRWRCLYYLHKDIICSGKAYPQANNDLVRKGLDVLAELVNQNLHWQYQYKNQRYYDMMNVFNNEDARHYYETKTDKNKKKHRIILYNYAAMYNDFACDHKEEYYCYRNWVPKTLKLCTSGPATCVICGKPMDNPAKMHNSIDLDCDFYSCGSRKVCCECVDKYYNAMVDMFCVTKPLHKCLALRIFCRAKTYFDFTQKKSHLALFDTKIRKMKLNIPALKYNILVTPNVTMPQKYYDILMEVYKKEMGADSLEMPIFFIEDYDNTISFVDNYPGLFKFIKAYGAAEEDLKTIASYFSPVEGEYIEQLPTCDTISLSK